MLPVQCINLHLPHRRQAPCGAQQCTRSSHQVFFVIFLHDFLADSLELSTSLSHSTSRIGTILCVIIIVICYLRSICVHGASHPTRLACSQRKRSIHQRCAICVHTGTNATTHCLLSIWCQWVHVLVFVCGYVCACGGTVVFGMVASSPSPHSLLHSDRFPSAVGLRILCADAVQLLALLLWHRVRHLVR